MNNKDFLQRMSEALNASPKEVQQYVSTFINELADKMDDGTVLSVQGFGNFEV